MPWTKVKRIRTQSDEPSVKVNSDRFSFNVVLAKLAELEKNRYVSIYFDEELRRIGFEFKKDSDSSDDFKVLSAGKAMSCSSREILSKPWVKKVAQLKKENAFAAKQDGKVWVITLCPAFEITCKRTDSNKIPSDAKGIYRYIQGAEIVYIGKGVIRDRLNEKRRAEWKFDIIEYSIIDDEQDALSWESFWIDRYKDENNSELPTYNLISGHAFTE